MWPRFSGAFGLCHAVMRFTLFACHLAVSAVMTFPIVTAARAQPTDGIRYEVEITGEPNDLIADLIKESSRLHTLRNRPPPTMAALSRRLAVDEYQVRTVLESEGYYDAQLESSVNRKDDYTVVTIKITPGELYTVKAIDLDVGSAAAYSTLEVLSSRTYEGSVRGMIGKPARASLVIAAEEAAIAALRNGGFPFAKRGDRDVEVDHADRMITVRLPIMLGPDAVFGDTRVEGESAVSARFLSGKTPWRKGAVFNTGELEKYRRDLIALGLFSSVTVKPAGTEDASASAPMDVLITVDDALHRTLGAGLKYARDKGAGASSYWEHRNLLGGGERFRLSADATEIDQTAKADFDKPGFLRSDQTLRLGLELRHSDTDAFREWAGQTSAALERELSEHWTVSTGASYEIADITEPDESRTSYLFGVPLSATWSTTDKEKILDPIKGWRVTLTTTPFVGSFDGSVLFLKSEAQASVYWPLNATQRTVLAARVKAGSIVGADTDRIPANRRFYAGGGGSIRGYGYQSVGPLDEESRPTGGRALLEGSLEVRYRINDTFGVVPFIDAGTVYRSSFPDSSGKMRAAAGVGGRYFTAVGPLRVDVAVPLERRKGVDKGFQFYISFGQAF